MGSCLSSQSPFIKDPSVYATRVQEKANPSNVQTYDYVIVGGGTAACVLAHRLTEDPSVTVLLIEAGKAHEGHLSSRMPAAFPKNFKSKLDWSYTTTKQPNVGNRALYWPAGKVLGGGSMINALIYQRPCADDIKEWARLGATGWEPNEFIRYIDKAEKYTLHPGRPNTDAHYRGRSGGWCTTHPDFLPISDNFLDACDSIGIPRIMDTSRPEGPLGAAFISSWIDQKGERSSAAHAYLTPAVLKRPNLTVAIETSVTKILISSASGSLRATGVELSKSPDAPLYQVNARREVLCCAGAIKTPQILTLSGIGPKAELERLGIPAMKELDAVGKNLCDHPVVTVAFRAKRGTTLDFLTTPTGGIVPLLRWLTTRSGPFAMLTGQAYAFMKSTDQSLPFGANTSEPAKSVDVSAGGVSPDLEFICAPVAYRQHGFIPGPKGHDVLTIGTILLRPQSSGSITLKSNSIWGDANIDPNYFADETDLDIFAKGIRLSIRVARCEPLVDQLELADDVEESDDIYFPGHCDPDKLSDDVLKRYIRRIAETLYHPMSTARIGQSSVDSVVNHELRVHGVSNLRVIDASVFPAPVAGHTCAVVIGLAEKAADMIKATIYSN